ncbi:MULTISPECIES: TrbI F-type domain-containing protein [Sphingomonadales]|uniref:TrbI F-type domain-containing protein n=1 Tax=Sphingobium phenoxybenzoativorans TaxID=1592790 RepID=A0A975K609_9SPHN|nr:MULTISPECIES: TrbI F-type domain-containing protein [Sphingomonadaceae]QUT05446.1 TrbI F-type domain-containing protein [Sphingobium phenoxybenzoativorans]
MADARPFQSFNRSLVLRLGGVLLAVCLLLWGAWVSREVARPREQIVTVRLSETIARFVDAEARSGKAPEDGQARTLAYLQAAEAAVREMGSNGRVVLVAEAVLSGDVPDATGELEQRVAAKLGREKRP